MPPYWAYPNENRLFIFWLKIPTVQYYVEIEKKEITVIGTINLTHHRGEISAQINEIRKDFIYKVSLNIENFAQDSVPLQTSSFVGANLAIKKIDKKIFKI